MAVVKLGESDPRLHVATPPASSPNPEVLSGFPSAYHSPSCEALPWRPYRPPTSPRPPLLGLPPRLTPPRLTSGLFTARHTLPSSSAGDLPLIL